MRGLVRISTGCSEEVRPFSELPDSENLKVAALISCPKISTYKLQNRSGEWIKFWEPVDHVQEPLGPFGPETQIKSEKISRRRESGLQSRESFFRLFPGSRARNAWNDCKAPVATSTLGSKKPSHIFPVLHHFCFVFASWGLWVRGFTISLTKWSTGSQKWICGSFFRCGWCTWPRSL